MSTEKFLVVGGSGNVGGALANTLVQKGHTVRATTSKDKPGSHNLEWAKVNVLTGEGLEKAFDGIDRAFLMVPGGYADQYDILAPMIREAKKRNLKKVVLQTAMGVEADPSGPYRRAEVDLETTGLPYNIIRPNWFMQNFYTFWIHGILSQGKIFVPGGTAKVSFIDSRDIAAVAAALLVDDSRNNKAFTLTGPQAINHDEAAKILSQTTGKQITYKDIDPSVFQKNLVAAGLTEKFAVFITTILGFLKAGYSAGVTDDVKQILGRAPISFEQFAKDNKSKWA